METWESYVTGPRWRDLAAWLRRGADRWDLGFRLTGESTGFLRKTVYFEIEGPPDRLQGFADFLAERARLVE